ncbi:hypothetical protein SAY87_002166 [Trapa incisa]|uniref:Uncharacterized protein n=1 Tax=Trapa incisa TaxID=236973 RepID=A0AAN7JWC5_9MYRT|nr:hypothetical protein SAY87_002166 [Trapa incisa]
MSSSTLECLRSVLEESLAHSSRSPDGVCAEADSAAAEDDSSDLLKHQLLPLTGNTSNLALIVLEVGTPRKKCGDRIRTSGRWKGSVLLQRQNDGINLWIRKKGITSIV